MWQHFIIGINQSLYIFDYIIELITPRLLYYSSHLFLSPIFYYIIANRHTKAMSILFSMIFTNFILSIAFWSDPIKHSYLHYIDAIAAKFSIIVMIIVTTIKRIVYSQTMKWYISCLSIMILFFYLSNIFSTIEWCSKQHLITHFIGHIMATITMFFVFH